MAKESLGRKVKNRIGVIVNVVVIVGLLGATGFYFKKHKDLSAKDKKQSAELKKVSDELAAYKADPNQASKAEANRIIADVAKLYALPKDEEPSVATVKDKDKLKDQPFFVNADNGDVTLIYSTAKLAILYRPSSKQIINVSSVTIQDQQTPAPTTP